MQTDLQQIADALSAAGLDHPAVDDAVIKLTNWAARPLDEVALAEVIQDHTGCGDSDSIYAAHAVIQHIQAAHPSRGVVDEAMVERAMDADAEEYGASIPASRVRRILEAAALQAAQPAVPSVPDVFILDRGFKYENGEHTPTVLVGFAPGDFDARDRFAASLAATPKDQPAQENDHE